MYAPKNNCMALSNPAPTTPSLNVVSFIRETRNAHCPSLRLCSMPASRISGFSVLYVEGSGRHRFRDNLVHVRVSREGQFEAAIGAY